MIIPILKPGKLTDQGSSYCPISLLCPAVKTLEKLLLPYITGPLSRAPSQHGFAPFHSTTTALLPIVTKIAEGFNANKPHQSATVGIDIAKAFVSVDHTLLINKITHTPLHPNQVRWLATYLRGRTASCHYQHAKSPLRIIHTGVPQGHVLSPALFNFFMADCPNVTELTTSYADNFTILESSPELQELEHKLSVDMTAISQWAEQNNFKIPLSKSQVTLFTPDTHQSRYHPQVHVNGDLIPLEKTPKTLGVTLDTHYSFTHHVSNVTTKVSN